MGRKPKLVGEEHGDLLNYVNIHQEKPLHVIALQYHTPNGAQFSKNTIRKYLYGNSIKSYVAAV